MVVVGYGEADAEGFSMLRPLALLPSNGGAAVSFAASEAFDPPNADHEGLHAEVPLLQPESPNSRQANAMPPIERPALLFVAYQLFSRPALIPVPPSDILGSISTTPRWRNKVSPAAKSTADRKSVVVAKK